MQILYIIWIHQWVGKIEDSLDYLYLQYSNLGNILPKSIWLFLFTGCSRGYVARHLTPDSVEKITLCDTNQSYLDQAQLPEGIEIIKMVADEETVEVNCYKILPQFDCFYFFFNICLLFLTINVWIFFSSRRIVWTWCYLLCASTGWMTSQNALIISLKDSKMMG